MKPARRVGISGSGREGRRRRRRGGGGFSRTLYYNLFIFSTSLHFYADFGSETMKEKRPHYSHFTCYSPFSHSAAVLHPLTHSLSFSLYFLSSAYPFQLSSEVRVIICKRRSAFRSHASPTPSHSPTNFICFFYLFEKSFQTAPPGCDKNPGGRPLFYALFDK